MPEDFYDAIIVMGDFGGEPAEIQADEEGNIKTVPASITVIIQVATVDITNIRPNQTLYFSATAAGPYAVATWLWNFGDGTTSALPSPPHAFSTAGAKTISLTVTDTEGNTGVGAYRLTVYSAPVGSLNQGLMPMTAVLDVYSTAAYFLNADGYNTSKTLWFIQGELVTLSSHAAYFLNDDGYNASKTLWYILTSIIALETMSVVITNS